MSTVIDGWTFTSYACATESGPNNGFTRCAITDEIMFIDTKYAETESVVPLTVLAELLRRAGWKVEAPE